MYTERGEVCASVCAWQRVRSFRCDRFILFAIVILCASLAVADAAPATTKFHIEAQEASKALTLYARQARVQLGYAADVIDGILTNPVNGEYENARALALLLEGTGLEALYGESGITIRRIPEREVSGDIEERAPPVAQTNSLRFAQASAAEVHATVGQQDEEEPAEEEKERRIPDEIVVTGTLIRGAGAGASPLVVIGRDDIDKTGFTTIQQLMASLPQNFGGGANEDALFGNDATENRTAVSSVNLRGLGGDSTLVLVNGRRVPQGGGVNGNVVDISSIPLSAIERIEILTDGASSIYGADAIAGVVNFILLDDFDGADTRLRFGTVTEGSLDEYQVSQTFGKSWDSGNILLHYEFYDRSKLGYEERSYTANSDLTALGGDDFRSSNSNPGNIILPASAAVPPNQDGTSLTTDDLLLGQVNLLNQNRGRDLLADQRRHSAYFSFNQGLAPSLRTYGDFRYIKREFENGIGGLPLFGMLITDANPSFVTPNAAFPLPIIRLNYNFIEDLGPVQDTGNVESLGGAFGARISFSDAWQFDGYGLYSREEAKFTANNNVNLLRLNEALGDFNGPFAAGTDNPDTSFNTAVDGFFNPFGDGSNSSRTVLEFIRGFNSLATVAEVWSVYGKADGELFEFPGGPVKVALGGEFREESFDRRSVLFVVSVEPEESVSTPLSREIVAGFGEIVIPLFGADNARPGLQSLDLSASVRTEHYSDFGFHASPKGGVAWSPFDGFKIRGTYGTSFKAPRLTALTEDGQDALVFNMTDPFAPDGSGDTFALFLQGSNPNLGPEKARTWTVGFDLSPSAIAPLNLAFTHYDITFTDRIAAPDNVFNVFFEPERFAPTITRDPDDAEVQAIIDAPFFDPSFGIPDPSDVEAIVDGRKTNLSRTRVRGIDFDARYGFDTKAGQFDLGLNGSYILNLKETFSRTTRTFELANTVRNPVDLKIRGNLSWNNDAGLRANAYINYLDSYSDNISDPNRTIDAWTTFDFRIQYEFDSHSPGSWLRGTSLSISVLNVLDEDPPFVNNPSGVAYDPENADPLGRLIAFGVRKHW